VFLSIHSEKRKHWSSDCNIHSFCI